MFIRYLTVFLLLLMASCKDAAPSETASAVELPQVSKYLNTIADQGFTGSILVQHKDASYAAGFGYSDEEGELKNSASTVFDIGSITKQFTGAAILKLEMMGKLSVEDSLPVYFENVPEDKQGITLHHLLTHSAGFPDAIGNDYTPISESEFVQQVLESPLPYPPGSQYAYSNTGYSFLAIIIEKVSGQNYEAFLSEQLFTPAGMTRTGYSMPNYSLEEVATGYREGNALGKPHLQNWDGNQPYLHLKGNGGILSTVTDMLKWHEALAGNGILSNSAKEKYYTPHIKEGPEARSFYGYGWVIMPTPRDTQLITHNGGNGVFFADMWRYLTEDITIIVMNNTGDLYAEEVAMHIAGLLLVDNYRPALPEDMAQNELQ